MEGFFCLKYLGHQECSFQDFVGFYKELTKSFDVFSGCFSWTCNIFDGESWVVYKAEYKSVRQEIPKNRRGKKKFSHASLPQSLLSCETDLAFIFNFAERNSGSDSGRDSPLSGLSSSLYIAVMTISLRVS